MTVKEALEHVGPRLQGRHGPNPIPVAELRREAAPVGGFSEASVLPSDFCYNRTNAGVRPGHAPLFLYVKAGMYRYVGPNHPYTGPLMHQPKGEAERQIGEWQDGVLTLGRDGEDTRG